VISQSCMSAANGNGWFAKRAATLPKVLRGRLSMLNAKPKPWRSSSAESDKIASGKIRRGEVA
jgi:hypothetical protein